MFCWCSEPLVQTLQIMATCTTYPSLVYSCFSGTEFQSPSFPSVLSICLCSRLNDMNIPLIFYFVILTPCIYSFTYFPFLVEFNSVIGVYDFFFFLSPYNLYMMMIKTYIVNCIERTVVMTPKSKRNILEVGYVQFLNRMRPISVLLGLVSFL